MKRPQRQGHRPAYVGVGAKPYPTPEELANKGKHGGARPGAGKKLGSTHKKVVAAIEDAKADIDRRARESGPASLSVMKQIMVYWMGKAANEQRKVDAAGNSKTNEKVVDHYLQLALHAAAKAAPYEHARLSNVRVDGSLNHLVVYEEIERKSQQELVEFIVGEIEGARGVFDARAHPPRARGATKTAH